MADGDTATTDTATIDPNQQLAAAQAQALDPANAPAPATNSQPLSTLIPTPSASDILSGVQNAAARAGSGDPQAPIQSNGMIPSQPLTGTVPEPPMSPGTWKHMEWLHGALNKVADALAPGDVARVVPQADGTFTVEKQPTTTKDKWGMIAARALGGAAAGLANAQGPGGLAKAAAAGTQYGLQQPQQQQQQAEQEADFKNKQLTAAANNALIHQKLYSAMLTSNQLKTQIDKQTADLLNSSRDDLASSPNAKDFGVISSGDDLQKIYNQDPDFFKAHTDLRLKAALMPKAGGGTELHAIAVDPGDDAMPIGKGGQLHQINVDPKTGEPTLTSIEPSATAKKGTVRAANQAVDAQYVELRNKWTDSQTRKEKVENTPDKNPTTATLAWKAVNDPNPDERTKARKALDLTKEKAGTGTAPATTPGINPAAAQIRDSGGTIDQALAAIPIADRNTVKAIGEGRMAPPSRFTKEGQRIMGLVNSVYPDYDATQFKTYQDARTRFTSGPEGTGMAFIQTARNHLARMETNIPDNVSIPWGVGSLINTVKNSANRSTSPTLKAFEDDLNAVSSEVAKAYSGKALTDSEHDKMMALLNESDSPEALKGAINEFRELLNGKLQSYRLQWNAAMPRGVVSPNLMLEGLEGGGGATPPPPAKITPPPTTIDQSNPPPINLVPPGHDTVLDNGTGPQTWRNVNGKAVRIK